jgi:hypothetical protein
MFPTPATPLGSTIPPKKLDPPVIIIYTSTNDIEALYKVSRTCIYDQPSKRRSKQKIFHTPPLTDPP